MKKNKIIPFSLLFIALIFLELFCIVRYSDIFYFPLAVGGTLLGSAYLLFSEIQSGIKSFFADREKPPVPDEAAIAEKEEAVKLAKASYVLEKRILNLLEERVLMPEENMENLGSLKDDLVRAVKASIKYERDNTKHLADTLLKTSGLTELGRLDRELISIKAVLEEIKNRGVSASSGDVSAGINADDLGQILSKFDSISSNMQNSQATLEAISEQLKSLAETAASAPLHFEQSSAYGGFVDNDNNETIAEVMEEPAVEIENEPAIEVMPEPVAEIFEDPVVAAEPVTEVFEEPVAATVSEHEPAPAPVADDPNKKMSPDDIAALFAAASEPAPVSEPAPAPAADDPNKKMSPDDIAALFAAASEPAPVSEPAPAPAPAADDPNKKMSPDDIAALFAAMGQ